MDALKIGGRHSADDRKKLQAIHDMTGEMGANHYMMKSGTMSSMLQIIHDQSVNLGAICGTAQEVANG
jgi:hypothetical protein